MGTPNFNLSGSVLFNELEESINNMDDQSRPLNRLRSVEEQDLSQRLNHLTTINTTANEQQSDQLKHIIDDFYEIPIYLKRKNQLFLGFINEMKQLFELSTTKRDIAHLQTLSIVIHRLKLIELYENLWNSYLKSGKGQLIQDTQNKLCYPTNISFWPKSIKRTIKLRRNESNPNEIFLRRTESNIQILNETYKKEMNRMNDVMFYFKSNSSQIQNMIKNYVEINGHQLYLRIRHEIDLISLDYHAYVIKKEFDRNAINSQQKRFMKDLCSLRYYQELYQQEYLLTHQIMIRDVNMDTRFDQSNIPDLSFFDSNSEYKHIGERLREQLKQIAIQARTQMIQFHLEWTEKEKDAHQKKYECLEKTIYNGQLFCNDLDGRSSILVRLIQERCTKISDRIKCVYQYKLAVIESNNFH